ncbi:hypothetical protein IKE67_07145 [bacterium]|nr:hypothetical protein [bacterium]
MRQRIFAGYLSEKICSYTCGEHIKNKEFMRRYFSPDNEYTVYSTAAQSMNVLRNIKPPFYDEPNEQAG